MIGSCTDTILFPIPQTKFDESIQFREKVQKYLGDVMKYVDHVIKTVGPADLLRLENHSVSVLMFSATPRSV